MRTPADTSPFLHRFAWFTAGATLLLICSGGMVTSKGVGLAVPDWPTTFGYNMFFFPVSKWVGGVFFEHTHRLIASVIGFLTIILTVWLWCSKAERWIKTLGWVSLGAVVLQGVLGGLRVTLLKDQIGIFHACLAQAFLGMVVIIALATSPVWRRLSRPGSAIPRRSLSDSCPGRFRSDLRTARARRNDAPSASRPCDHRFSARLWSVYSGHGSRNHRPDQPGAGGAGHVGRVGRADLAANGPPRHGRDHRPNDRDVLVFR